MDLILVRTYVVRDDSVAENASDTIVTPFTTDYLSTYLSLCPSPSDAVLSFGPMDVMMAPASHYLPTRLYNLFPHPAQDVTERRRYVVMLTSRYVHRPHQCREDVLLTFS